MSTMLQQPGPWEPAAAPRLGFVGVGWIGRHRMESLAASGAGRVAAIADTSAERLAEAAAVVPDAVRMPLLADVLEMELDGIVVATPSALHAQQCIRALEAGVAVFCQKPLARTAEETRTVVAAARAADRLLGVDLSYRHTAAMQAVRRLVRDGDIGNVYAADLTFHNAYGPDGGWARDPALSGGGCVIDLGTHLVDLALWVLDFPQVRSVHGQRYARGQRLLATAAECEDYAVATIELASGAVVRVACSWESSTGRDAVIEATFTGSAGSAAMRNVDGSFYDFVAEHCTGTSAITVASPPDDWGGRALEQWARRLATGQRYDPDIEHVITVATTLDGVLGR
ncbi:MAG TPA: Gfo/Idh/MocA family oxidoreductase [Longimicrobiales bacterium]|nr:Gfo/Idh/MocA family oxidoreductase [Longimicrobiales bacterium]